MTIWDTLCSKNNSKKAINSEFGGTPDCTCQCNVRIQTLYDTQANLKVRKTMNSFLISALCKKLKGNSLFIFDPFLTPPPMLIWLKKLENVT